MLCSLIFLLAGKNIIKWLRRLAIILGYKSNRFFLISWSMVMATTFFCCNMVAQSKTLNYKIVQNGKVIGWMELEKTDSTNTSLITLRSETKKRFVLLFEITEKQQSFFVNGVMTKSYVYRKINDDVKVDKNTVYAGNYYQVTKGNSSTRVELNHVNFNQLSLYFYEPLNMNEVYSDNYERYVKVEKKEKHNYLIEFPDGNKNFYCYNNGVCSKVRVEQNLFTVEFILSD